MTVSNVGKRLAVGAAVVVASLAVPTAAQARPTGCSVTIHSIAAQAIGRCTGGDGYHQLTVTCDPIFGSKYSSISSKVRWNQEARASCGITDSITWYLHTFTNS